MISTEAKSTEDAWRHVYRVCHRHSLCHSLGVVEAELCATEFAEQIVLLLDTSERNALLAAENFGLLCRRSACFVLNWKKRVERRQHHEVCFSDLPEVTIGCLSESTDLFVYATSAHILEVLRQAVACMPPKQRECALHCWFEQETATETAAFLKMTPDAVRKNVQRAKEKMPEVLKQMGIEMKEL